MTSALSREQLREDVAAVMIEHLNVPLQAYKTIFEQTIAAGKDSTWKSSLGRLEDITARINALDSSEKKSEYVLKLNKLLGDITNIDHYYTINSRLADDDLIVAKKLKELQLNNVQLQTFNDLKVKGPSIKKIVGDYIDGLSAEEKSEQQKLVNWYEGLTERSFFADYIKFFETY